MRTCAQHCIPYQQHCKSPPPGARATDTRAHEDEGSPEGGLGSRCTGLAEEEDDELDAIVYLPPKVSVLPSYVVQYSLDVCVGVCACDTILNYTLHPTPYTLHPISSNLHPEQRPKPH